MYVSYTEWCLLELLYNICIMVLSNLFLSVNGAVDSHCQCLFPLTVQLVRHFQSSNSRLF